MGVLPVESRDKALGAVGAAHSLDLASVPSKMGSLQDGSHLRIAREQLVYPEVLLQYLILIIPVDRITASALAEERTESSFFLHGDDYR